MKQIFSLLLLVIAVLFLISFTGCSDDNDVKELPTDTEEGLIGRWLGYETNPLYTSYELTFHKDSTITLLFANEDDYRSGFSFSIESTESEDFIRLTGPIKGETYIFRQPIIYHDDDTFTLPCFGISLAAVCIDVTFSRAE